MKDTFLLLKNSFYITFGLNKFLKYKPYKLILIFLLICYVVFSLLVSFTSYSNMVADILIQYNILSFMLVIFYAIVSFTTFMFSVNIAKGSLFNSNDNDLLFSMPIKPNSILASRLIISLIWNLLTSLLLIIPVIYVYVSRVDVSVIFYFIMFLVFITMPIIPTIIASFIGFLIAYFTAKSNKKNWFEILSSLFVIFVIYYLMYNGGNIINTIAQSKADFLIILKYAFYPLYLVNGIFSNNNYFMLIQYLVINGFLLLIFLLLLSKKYQKIISKLQENKIKSNYVMTNLKSSSISKTLLIKEMKRYFSSPIYVLNTSFGILLIIALAIATIFFDKNQLLVMLGFSSPGISIFQMTLILIAFVTFLSSTTSSAISIEGNNFWILKSLPINNNKILNSKILFNILLVTPITFISIFIFKFTMSLSILEMFLLMFLLLLFSICSSQFGILVNLKFPRMDAPNDVVIVKRSLSSMISIMIPLLLIFLINSLYSQIIKIITFNIMILIIIIIVIIIIVIEKIILNGWGIKRFKEIM